MQCRCTTVERSVLSVDEVSRHANTLFAGVSGFCTPLGLSPNLPLPQGRPKGGPVPKAAAAPTDNTPAQPASQPAMKATKRTRKQRDDGGDGGDDESHDVKRAARGDAAGKSAPASTAEPAPRFRNKEKVLVLCSRGVTYRYESFLSCA